MAVAALIMSVLALTFSVIMLSMETVKRWYDWHGQKWVRELRDGG